MPRVVREYKVQARERIVGAARAVFRRKGFRATRMEDIAAELGVSKGAIYLYFRTKNELLGEIQARSRQQVLVAWERLLERGDVAEGIADSLQDVLSGDVDPGIWHELIGEAATNPDVRATLEVDHLQDVRSMEEFLRRLESRGRIRRLGDRKTVAGIILALLSATVLDLMMHGQPERARRTLIRSLRYLLEKDR